MSNALVTDLYELNMAASYLRHEMTGTATFSLFCRRLPRDRGFLVAAVSRTASPSLRSLPSTRPTLSTSRALALPRTPCVAFVPSVSRVRCGRCRRGASCSRTSRSSRLRRHRRGTACRDLPAQPVHLSDSARHQSSALSNRCPRAVSTSSTSASVETHGVEAGIAVARLSAMCGFAATSNVEAARRFELRPSGTMAHSYVEAFDDRAGGVCHVRQRLSRTGNLSR